MSVIDEIVGVGEQIENVSTCDGRTGAITAQSGKVSSNTRPSTTQSVRVTRRPGSSCAISAATSTATAGTRKLTGTNTPHTVSTTHSAPQPAAMRYSEAPREPQNAVPTRSNPVPIPQVVTTARTFSSPGTYSAMQRY